MSCLKISVCLILLVLLAVPEMYGQVKSSSLPKPDPNFIIIGDGGGGGGNDPIIPACGGLTIYPQITSQFIAYTAGSNTANVTIWWGNNGATDYVVNDGDCRIHMDNIINGQGPLVGISNCSMNTVPMGSAITYTVTAWRDCRDNFGDLSTEQIVSDPVTITVKAGAPTGLVSGAISDTQAKLSWAPSAGVSTYLVDVGSDPGFFNYVVNGSPLHNISVSSPTLTFTVPSPNNTYYFRVRAVNGGGQSDYSATGSATVMVPTLTASDNAIRYEQPAGVQLTTQAGQSNYKWFLGGNQISGASTNTIQATTVGTYSVSWCANYSDGTQRCPSKSITLSGESMTINYVQKRIPQIGNIQQISQLDSIPNQRLVTVTDYVDGIGRPVQHVERGSSPLGKDIVSVSRYDAFDRTPKQYLPFVRKTNDGSYMYMPSSLSPILNFYQAGNDNIADTPVPFAETALESSPLSRPLKQGSPGVEWQINNNHAKSIKYTTNSTSDKVFLWSKTQTGVSASSYYPVGTLVVTELTDEDGHRSREYKDKDGRVVASDRIIENDARLRTYFVFDDAGKLQFVLPPKTISDLPNSTSVSITTDVLARECYSYQYDERNRQIIKTIPGGGSIYTMYDKWDRVVLTQHSNERAAGKWSFYKYDALDRVIMTGQVSLAGDYSAAQQAIISFYANVQSTLTLRYEEMGGSIHGYTNRSFPVLTSQFQAFTVSYYDNYNFVSQFGGTPYQFSAESSIGVTGYSTLVQSLATGGKTLILGSQTYLKTVNYYDSKHRRVQALSDNHQGGIDRTSFAYDFVGKVMHSKESHNGLQAVSVVQDMQYDHRGRATKAYHTINNGSKILLSSKKYNELGQMIEQNLHSTDGNTFLQSQDFQYNIRGWLTVVNPTETESNVQFQDQYGYELSYVTAPSVTGLTGFQSAYNGNITAFTEVRPGNKNLGGAAFKSSYAYGYDARNQLTQANFVQVAGPTLPTGTSFSMPSITYDANGNIKSLKRLGIISGNAAGTVDDLHYNYTGNQLNNVTDSGDLTKGFIKK